MGCAFSFKWLFAFIGMYAYGGRGFLFGFLLGALFDSVYKRPTIHFTYYKEEPEGEQQTYGQTWHPYVNQKLQQAYQTLGLTETATDDEVRQAYRTLALRYHPDKVASQGEQVRKAAEKLFQQIGEAKDIIYKARGIK